MPFKNIPDISAVVNILLVAYCGPHPSQQNRSSVRGTAGTKTTSAAVGTLAPTLRFLNWYLRYSNSIHTTFLFGYGVARGGRKQSKRDGAAFTKVTMIMAGTRYVHVFAWKNAEDIPVEVLSAPQRLCRVPLLLTVATTWCQTGTVCHL